ncbi:MAG: PAS domain S-box protein [Nitrospinae bacterium]|nr:PAS domain S-box protein [Nitrospinota bacterium]
MTDDSIGNSEGDDTGQCNKSREDWYRLIFDSDEDPMFVFPLGENGVFGDFVDVNDAALRKLGYSREAMLQMSISTLIGEEVTGALENLAERLSVNRRADMECILNGADGSAIAVDASFTLFEAGGQPTVLAVAHPQSGADKIERELDIAERRISAIIRTVGEGIVVIDGESNILYVNQELLNIFGYSIEELIGECVHILMPEKYRSAHSGGMQRYLAGGHSHIIGRRLELEGVRKDGSVFPLEIRVEETRLDERNTLFTAAIRDISVRKAGEVALREAKEHAEEATKLKDKFVSLVAHDLKSPLTSIVGLLRLVNKDIGGSLPVKYKEMLWHISKSGERIIQIIDDLLNITRLSTGAIKPERRFVDGAALAEAAMESFKYIASEKGVGFVNNVTPGLRLYADPGLFEHVLQNLISNAIKFSSRGGAIEVFNPPGQGTAVAVKDSGVGIGAEIIPALFKHDVKTSTVGTNGEKGTGLGLPYCGEIMDAHGGSITVESVIGEGSVFYVRLPEKRPLVMIVEDEKIVRKVYRRYLENIGAEVLEAANGKEALEMLEKIEPNLIIMDIFMPVMSGFELLVRIRGEVKTKAIPVIVVTSDSNMETREKAFRLGADDFISKLMEPADFIPRVRRFII